MTRPMKDPGARAWYQDGAIHRLHGPAIEFRTGTKIWYHRGLCHRLHGPAVEWRDGRKSWSFMGKQYREMSPGLPDLVRAAKIGQKRLWFDREGLAHRQNGPAEEDDHGRKAWFQHGLMSRMDLLGHQAGGEDGSILSLSS